MTEFERQLDLLLGDALTELERLQKRKWMGLTEEEIEAMTKNVVAFRTDIVDFIRRAEAKLREKNT